MAWLKKFLFVITALIVLLVVVGFILPSSYQVERKVLINASAEDIYPNVVNLKAWPQWGVWFKRDPNMEISYAGPDRAIGMQMQWKSETQGDGQMEIVDLKHNRKLTYSLYFPEFEMGSTGDMTLEPVDGGTLVTWSDSGDLGASPVNRYMGLMMDGMIGPDFELGLENLKTVSEH